MYNFSSVHYYFKVLGAHGGDQLLLSCVTVYKTFGDQQTHSSVIILIVYIIIKC